MLVVISLLLRYAADVLLLILANVKELEGVAQVAGLLLLFGSAVASREPLGTREVRLWLGRGEQAKGEGRKGDAGEHAQFNKSML